MSNLTASPKENALSVTSSILLLAGIFHGVFKLPQIAGSLMMLAAGICMYVGVRLRQARLRNPTNPASDSPPARPTNRIWMLIAIYAVTCALCPFVLPYSGLNVPFSELVIISVIPFIICLTVTFFSARRQP
jgi:hydrogenase/urease accessory protein HupE